MMSGDLYLRRTIPCFYAPHPGGQLAIFPTKSIVSGQGSVAVSEVSPTTVEWEKNLTPKRLGKELVYWIPSPSGYIRQQRKSGLVYWGFRPNEVIRFARLYYRDHGVIEVWAEGSKERNNIEIRLQFVGISSLEDFKKAFDLVLSPRQIQDDHPEWPPDIRKAIADRTLVLGMTQAQASAIVGTPLEIKRSEENGLAVEAWSPRQEKGSVTFGYLPIECSPEWATGWIVSGAPHVVWRRPVSGQIIAYVQRGPALWPVGATGFPVSLRFVDGKIVTIGPVMAPEAVHTFPVRAK
jgi:hypothetical protein